MFFTAPFPDALVRIDDSGRSLAICVIAPTAETTAWEVMERLSDAFKRGVDRVWLLISQAESVYVFDNPAGGRGLTRADELTGDPIIPGFRVAVADLFPLTEPTP